MDDWDIMQMEFMSKGLKILGKAAKLTAVAALAYASYGNNYTENYPIESAQDSAQVLQIEDCLIGQVIN